METYDKYNDPELRRKFALWWKMCEIHKYVNNFTHGQWAHVNNVLSKYANGFDMSPTDWNDMITLIYRYVQHMTVGPFPDIFRPVMGKLTVDELKEKLGARNDDLVGAIRSGSEIMVYGEFYAFQRETWERHIKKLLWNYK